MVLGFDMQIENQEQKKKLYFIHFTFTRSLFHYKNFWKVISIKGRIFGIKMDKEDKKNVSPISF